MNPASTGRKVVSATQTRSGAEAVKSRCKRFGAIGSAWLESVVRFHRRDRKSTRLNSSHLVISYAVFCLKKKKKNVRHSPRLTTKKCPLRSSLCRHRRTHAYYPSDCGSSILLVSESPRAYHRGCRRDAIR